MKKLEVSIIESKDRIYLISDDSNWREGLAYDTARKEVIYYNGDYGEARPDTIKRVVANHEQIGYVEIGRRVVKSGGYPVDHHTYYEEIKPEQLKYDKKCFVELNDDGNVKYLSEKIIIHYE